MIHKMTKYSFILLSGEQDGFLEKLQELGLMDITRSIKPVDDQSAALLGTAEKTKGILDALGRIGFPEELEARPVEGDPEETARKALDRLASLEEARKAVLKDIHAREPWGAFDAERLAALMDAGYRIHFHAVASKSFREEWAETLPMQVVSETAGKTYFVTVLPDGENDPLPDEVAMPAGSVQEAKEGLDGIDAEIRDVKAVLLGVRAHIGEMEQDYERKLGELDVYLASTAAVPAAENTIVTLVGYAPTECDEAVTAFIDESGVFYLKDAAAVEDNPPIRFRNNKFVKMFEVLTDMYGRPAYDGFDPTPFIAVFFLLFFAFCMGDAGYGLILIVIGLLLRKADSFKGFAPLVVTLGIGTTVIGFLFHTFFSMDIAEWPVFAPFKGIFLPAKIAGYDGTMILALVVGIFHICLAMVVKTVNDTRTKGFANSLGTWGWTLLVVGGVIVGGFALAGVLDKELTRWIIIGIGALSAAGIFLLNDLHRNPLLNIGAGLWETYNTVTGLLGDVLSYLRLYALGLAGAMLGKAFNDIGGMVLGDGSGIVGWIAFILIVLIGHTLNIAMAALGAFVHPLRLNFLEFFKNSGYEGSGRNYHPLKK
jgi:V/A-type H+-transporting ATPase subunit I